MKIYFRLPQGTEFHLEREPMSNKRFGALCGLAAGAMVLLFLLSAIWAT